MLAGQASVFWRNFAASLANSTREASSKPAKSPAMAEKRSGIGHGEIGLELDEKYYPGEKTVSIIPGRNMSHGASVTGKSVALYSVDKTYSHLFEIKAAAQTAPNILTVKAFVGFSAERGAGGLAATSSWSCSSRRRRRAA